MNLEAIALRVGDMRYPSTIEEGELALTHIDAMLAYLDNTIKFRLQHGCDVLVNNQQRQRWAAKRTEIEYVLRLMRDGKRVIPDQTARLEADNNKLRAEVTRLGLVVHQQQERIHRFDKEKNAATHNLNAQLTSAQQNVERLRRALEKEQAARVEAERKRARALSSIL